LNGSSKQNPSLIQLNFFSFSPVIHDLFLQDMYNSPRYAQSKYTKSIQERHQSRKNK